MEWMPVHDAVLEFLADYDELVFTPNNIAENTGYSASYLSDRVRELADAGFVRRTNRSGDPFYTITDKGRERIAEDD